MKRISPVLTIIVLAAMLGCESSKTKPTVTASGTPQDLSAAEAQAIAREAYIYGFPMVVGYKLLYNYAVDKDSPDYKGPFNQLSCEARLFTRIDTGLSNSTNYMMGFV